MMTSQPGGLIISLDFELYWGVRDKRTLEEYGDRLRAVHEVVPRLLKLFRDRDIHCTWATVGLLFLRNTEESETYQPELLPQYHNSKLSPYPYLKERVANSYPQEHFAPDLISLIRETPGQEIGSHTFSHYYCLEKGQGIEAFQSDLEQSIKVSQVNGVNPESFVFPRNQWNRSYLQAIRESGMKCYRGNESSFFYQVTVGRLLRPIQRVLRYLDRYLPLSGDNSFLIDRSEFPINVPSSRFLAPAQGKMSFLEKLRISRIKRSMSRAARNRRFFHLWWHPHNFGHNMESNFLILTELLDHYQELNQKYGFQSYSMREAAFHHENTDACN